ncbi:BsuPI-related putative proteinase inhibitor [Natrinema halophilum]|uniref:Intracellular proteinase inhibitor BsuPI domain-containing protein n=1 Tax=Natrinema halophilum TaxID=1699371 RepID=A0A7D5KQG8_9EURY|nr:BsuPI-related putative proteinase inhibitor [Natrinema halophilum]QLG47384.1 BsuPI-related putative proteinase inhibitor [Natrinema halophilum]
MTLEGSLETTGEDSRDAVLFVFTVTNDGDETVELRFSDACKADFIVADGDEEVWRFTDGRMFAQVLSSETIEPGTSTSYEAEWTDPEPGEYVARAELKAQDRTCEARIDVSIPS